MKNLIRVFGVFLCLLAALPSMADEARLEHLVSQAEAAVAREDRQELGRLSDEIYALTTGLDPALEGKPEHLSNADYQNRLCPYRKTVTALHITEDIEYLHHEMRAAALRIAQRKEENAPYVLAIIECAQDNGEPVPEARALIKGIEWARKFEAADTAELQDMAREYGALSQKYPDDALYPWFNTFIVSQIEHNLTKKRAEKARQRLNTINYRAALAEKADKGDLSAQLEVAQRLETGERFDQNNHFAYYWYKRALQNGGGEAAQTAMDRLLPHLDEIDLMRVKNWLKKKYTMY